MASQYLAPNIGVTDSSITSVRVVGPNTGASEPFGVATSGQPPIPATFGQLGVTSRSPSVNYSRSITPSVPNSGDGNTGLAIRSVVSHAYPVRPFKQLDYHNHLNQRDLIFTVGTPSGKREKAYTMVNVGQSNEVMNRGYYGQFVQGKRSANADALILLDYNEKGLQHHMTENSVNIFTKPETKWMRWGNRTHLAKLFSFMGISLSGCTAATLVPMITVAPHGNVEVTDIWGKDAMIGARCLLVLKRTSNDGPFAFVPWASLKDASPTLRMRTYRAISGRLEEAICIYIGRVLKRYDGSASKSRIERAIGLSKNGTASDRIAAERHLPMIEIDTGWLPGKKHRFA